MIIKFLKIGKKYIIYDSEVEGIIGKECLISWEYPVDLEAYFIVDEKGCIYDQATGAPVGYMEVV